MERKSKSKKILAGMMAGFSVLSTQSVLGSFQKLPMGGGGCNLISYAETGNSTSISVTIEVDALNPNDYKGTLKYKINFGSKTDNFAINTILRNSGVKKAVADGKTSVWAKDVSETALKIAGTENFFKAKADGGSSLIGFKLTAKYADTSGASKREELLLNTTQECITAYDENGGVQEGNTYQIINKDDVYSKLYWGADGGEDANKLIFEIPIELPKKVKVENQDHSIKAFKISVSHMDSECIDKHAEQLDGNRKCKGITYALNSGSKTAEVKKYDNSGDGNVIIPDYVKDANGDRYAVTSIGAYAFYGCSDLTSVKIGNDVKTIGDVVFCGCSSLASVTIGNGVTDIGGNAFRDCSSLTSVTIKSDKLSSVGNFAFSALPANGTIYVPDSEVENDSYKNLFTSKGLPSTWTFKKLSEKPAE